MDKYATDKDKREYNEMMNKALDDALIEALGCKPLNSKDLRGASSKVPVTPEGPGLLKS